MPKKVIAVFVVAGLLVTSNLVTYAYLINKMRDMRKRSSFQIMAAKENLPDGPTSLVACLNAAKIENRVEDGNVLVREVDGSDAVTHCS